MKWSVLSGCSALFALACSGTNGAENGGGWYGEPAPREIGGESSVAGAGTATGGGSAMPSGGYGAGTATGGSGAIPNGGYGAGTATGGGGAIPSGGFGAGTATGGGGAIPSGGFGAGTATGGSGTMPNGGYGAVSAGGAEAGGGEAGGNGGVDPNSCSHDVARCFEAAAACYEYSPWSDCDQIVDVCSAMEMQCQTAKSSMGMGASSG